MNTINILTEATIERYNLVVSVTAFFVDGMNFIDVDMHCTTTGDSVLIETHICQVWDMPATFAQLIANVEGADWDQWVAIALANGL